MIGAGAREHAICASLASEPAAEVFCAPGNPGIAAVAPVEEVTPTDPDSVVSLARRIQPDLVVIGPEGPLVAGVTDALRAAGFAVFGPSSAAAAIEGSKAFAKDVMSAAGVPTALSRVCTSASDVEAALDEFGAPFVVKDDGLAAGKGVVVTSKRDEAVAHAHDCIAAGNAVVIEEYLDGPEVSLFGITDGTTVYPLSPAQDFKRIFDGDHGPNTGGMGAYTPLPWTPAGLEQQVLKEVLQPTVDEMARRGTPFSGLLYAGLALTSKGVRVIEFNARFGDPETQVVLARLASPLSQLLLAAATHRLSEVDPPQWNDTAAVTVVLAAQGYPERPQTGARITGLDSVQGVTVFHAGTALHNGELVVAGGRVLSVTATGNTLAAARQRAYDAVDVVNFDGMQYRTDIALVAAQDMEGRP